MKRPTVRCPVTDQLVPIEVAIDDAVLDRITVTGQSIDCPHCGQVHAFGPDDVVFEPEHDAIQ